MDRNRGSGPEHSHGTCTPRTSENVDRVRALQQGGLPQPSLATGIVCAYDVITPRTNRKGFKAFKGTPGGDYVRASGTLEVLHGNKIDVSIGDVKITGISPEL